MNNYSALQKFLHRISLSPRFMREISFDLEQGMFLKKCQNDKVANHVFVTGLARSGTTIILNAIYETGNFASLTYEGMPFILSPNLWNKINVFETHKEAAERAHGDGIMVTTNSPEAFEEVFWNTFEDEENWETLFQNYVTLILHKYKKTRYLSKNNQNIRRVERIRSAFPDAQILIPFRDPLQHCFSLLSQHKKFSKEQENDKFIRNYMNWIGHSEFGLDYKPIMSGNLDFADANTLDHWLEQWYLLYTKLYETHKEDRTHIHFICYETLCRNEQVHERINNILNITIDPVFSFRESKKKIEEKYSSELLQKCMGTYEKLAALQRQN